jgi:hypothetical protein
MRSGLADFTPAEHAELAKFDGKQWVLFGDVVGK